MEKDNRFIVYIEKSIIRNWDRDALTDHDTGTTLQFKDVARKIAKFHIIFESAGIKPGDKIALCGRNCSNWAVTFLATMTYGAVIVPILHELKADNIHNIVNHSEAKMLFIYDKLWPQLNIDEMPDLILVATLSDFNLAACRNDKVKDALENRNAISLGHVFGMTYDFLFGFTTGAHLHFLTKIPSPNIIAETFPKIRPRVISCVPLVIEKAIKKSILPRIDSKIGRLLLHIPIINEKIKKSALHEAKEIFGGNFDEIIIGGAPFNAEVERFLKQIGFPYTIAYGMTECGPIICSSRWEDLKLASCGKATTRMEVKIDSKDPKNVAGEIICRGANLMLGYYKNPEATSMVIDKDGWLHTGDLATMDSHGNVTIRGRSKNMLLTASGQNIYPEEIESKLNNMQYVSESIIILDDNKLVALVYPELDEATNNGVSKEELEKAMEMNRKELNVQLPSYCQISKIRLRDKEFEKTAKKSIKRYLYQK